MASKNVSKDDIIVSSSQNNEELYLISDGSVIVSAPGIRYSLSKGDVIGAVETGFDAHFFSYMAGDDTQLIPVASEALYPMIAKKNDFSAYLYRSALQQIIESIKQYFSLKKEADKLYELADETYRFYRGLCDKVGVNAASYDELYRLGRFIDDGGINERIAGYYAEIANLVTDGRKVSPEFLDVFILKLGKDARAVSLGAKKVFIYLSQVGQLVLENPKTDLYGILTDSYLNSAFSSVSDTLLGKIREIEEYINKKPYINPNRYFERTSAFDMKVERTKLKADHTENEQEIFAELEDSVDKILDYAGVDDKTRSDFKSLIISYRALADPRSQDDAARHIRLDISNYFYKIYELIVLKVLGGAKPSRVIMMFLLFGYMDEELCTKSDLFYLYEKAAGGFTDPEKGVFTFFEWLQAIYMGKRLPSKNEFDIDYEAFVHERKVKNQITAEEEKKLMSDRVSMVKYELKNMFVSANKVTFGLITIFCPIFNSVNVVRKLPDGLITAGLVSSCIDAVRATDFQLFYRDTLYSNEAIGLKGEYIGVEVLPDFILMPNVGTRGLMWQEIQGRVRTTHSRMMLPVFDIEDMKAQILHMCGEYRWEMCKRVQGARWNDVTDPSLTSEYFDYVQFYRKNHELSKEVKERVKLSLQRAKNSFKEMFVMDYMIWVAYESEGSPRLNKVSRGIISKYCPFPAATRAKLLANPTYKENFEYYERKQGQKIHRMEMLIQKTKNAGVIVPDELINELEFLKG
ncbi:MAG: hypothetical protein IJ796_10080 [Lachnospiraceae bacterium]|nr:hypothetical protein [Lachnospiraceae bacterium]